MYFRLRVNKTGRTRVLVGAAHGARLSSIQLSNINVIELMEANQGKLRRLAEEGVLRALSKVVWGRCHKGNVVAKTIKGRGGSHADTRLKEQGVRTRLCEGREGEESAEQEFGFN